MKNCLLILIVISASCSNYKLKGEWGVTVGDCDEICTVYFAAQQEVMKYIELFDGNFPTKVERRKHVLKTQNGHKIKSWFKVIKNSDTTINEFSCVVIYNNATVGYLIENLEINKTNFVNASSMKLEKDTVTIVLNYYGWACPCPQWITSAGTKTPAN